MADPDDAESLQGLYKDLIALSQLRLQSLDRLWAELESHVEDLKNVFEENHRKDSSRKALLSGRITIDEDEYSLNKEFQESACQLADTLDLDEVEAAGLLLRAQDSSQLFDRPLSATAIILHQRRRDLLLECLRLLLEIANNDNLDQPLCDQTKQIISMVLDVKGATINHNESPVQRCHRAMVSNEFLTKELNEKVLGNQALNGLTIKDNDDVAVFQQHSLARQHESLSGIFCLLVKKGYSVSDDFSSILTHVARLDRWNHVCLHYLPILLVLVAQFGSPEGQGTFQEARNFHSQIVNASDNHNWTLRELHAAFQVWWLAEYSGYFQESQAGLIMPGLDAQQEAEERSVAFHRALANGAFQSILAICSHLSPVEWYDPTKTSIIAFLMRDTTSVTVDSITPSAWFHDLAMQQLEVFIDAVITNMPDTLREFKMEEDDQRKRLYSNLQRGAQGGAMEQELHLERFLTIIALSFEGRPEASECFFTDPDGNLYGFLQWAAKRQTTPFVAAFCEMLQALSIGDYCAGMVHKFLLDDGGLGSARLRKQGSLSWSQIFGELTVYTSKLRDNPSTSRMPVLPNGKPNVDDIDEPESAIMLESYLRLISHLSLQSADIRSWILSQSAPNMIETAFTLCSSTVPIRLQASAIALLRTILTDKALELSLTIWDTLDNWASGYYGLTNALKASKTANSPAISEEITFATLSGSFDLANEFTALLTDLVTPIDTPNRLDNRLPFPDNLGSSYRMPGIEPYIDLVLGKLFPNVSGLMEDPSKGRILNYNILQFAGICLKSFNEEALTDAINFSVPVAAYARLHPFARVMEWMFNDNVIAALFITAHQDIKELGSATPSSPLVESLVSCLNVMSLVIDLQSTYFNLVLPLIANGHGKRGRSVRNVSLASFEDSVALHLRIVIDLGLYSGLGNQQLTMSSLTLLRKLTSSPRLNSTRSNGRSQRGNRLVEILEYEEELDRIGHSLAVALELDLREVENGPNGPDWMIKMNILNFLLDTLSSSPNDLSMAHYLLGFHYQGTDIAGEARSQSMVGKLLFDRVVDLIAQYPDGDDESFCLWALTLRQTGTEILQTLWRSLISSVNALRLLRDQHFLSLLALHQHKISAETHWDGRNARDPGFLSSDSAETFHQYLIHRRSYFEYAAVELRLNSRELSNWVKGQAASVLGPSNGADHSRNFTPAVFDLLDFVEFEIPQVPQPPDSDLFRKVTSVADDANISDPAHRLKLVEDVLSSEWKAAGALESPHAEDFEPQLQLHAALVIDSFRACLNFYHLQSAREAALSSWVDLFSIMIEYGAFDNGQRESLVAQALQVLAPKLTAFTKDTTPGALSLANLVQLLLCKSDSPDVPLNGSTVALQTQDGTYQMFCSAMSGIGQPTVTTQVRQVLYNICFYFLLEDTKRVHKASYQKQQIHSLKAAGPKWLDIIYDDALGGPLNCRTSALLLLDVLYQSLRSDQQYLLDNMTSRNFFQILIESIGTMPHELREANTQEFPAFLRFCEARLSLLASICQSKVGAAQALDAGLFHAVRVSGLYAVDPDIGIEMASSEALGKYYRLLLFITRVITSAVLAKGERNDRAVQFGRQFLVENRALVVATFKRQAKLGGVSFDDAGLDIDELVELFTLLICVTSFLEHDGQREDSFPPRNRFA